MVKRIQSSCKCLWFDMQQEEDTRQAVYLDLLCRGCSRGESILIHSSWRSFHPWKWTSTSQPSWSTSTILASHHLSPRWSLASNLQPWKLSLSNTALMKESGHYLFKLDSIVFFGVDIFGPRILIHVQDVTDTPRQCPSASACCHLPLTRPHNNPRAGHLTKHPVLCHNRSYKVSQMLVFDISRLTQKSHFIRTDGRHLALH